MGRSRTGPGLPCGVAAGALWLAVCALGPAVAEEGREARVVIKPGFSDHEPVRKLEVRITTSEAPLAGTSNEVWLDVGPRAWKLLGPFVRGETRVIPLDLGKPTAWPMVVGDVVVVRLEKKGINGWADAPDSLFDVMPGHHGPVTSAQLREYYQKMDEIARDLAGQDVVSREVLDAAKLMRDVLKVASGLGKKGTKDLHEAMDAAKELGEVNRRVHEEANREREEAKRKLADLDLLAKTPPDANTPLPRPGEWRPKSVTLIVNGKDYVECPIDRWLKQGDGVWFAPVARLSPAEMFVNRLRVDKGGPGGFVGGQAAAVTTVFKRLGIAGWDDRDPVQKATVVGVLRNTPSPGTDGVVGLDFEVKKVTIGKDTYVLDGRHNVRHTRYLRARYAPRDDSRYRKWRVGERFEVSGRVRWDADGGGFFGIHPDGPNEIKRLP